MSTMLGSLIIQDLFPIFGEYWGLQFKEWDPIYTKFFKKVSSKGRYYETVSLGGSGFTPVKPEGSQLNYGIMTQMNTAFWQSATYSKGFEVTEEMLEDAVNVFDVGKTYMDELSRSLKASKELVHANMWNNAFSSSFVGGDGVALVSASHPLATGSTASNTATTNASLSITSAEQACIDVANFVSNSNVPMHLNIECLQVPPALMHVATKILKSNGMPATTNNDINSIRVNGLIKSMEVNPYLSSTTAYYFHTDCAQGAMSFEKIAPTLRTDRDFNTTNMRFAIRSRFSPLWGDWRCVYANQGL